ncbi:MULTISPECIES: hypothetical protein [Brevibacillus]|uniref:hypothetical protein n=1 Tax=Brevibacillus TaxID=55080 RepID=UPI00287FABE4|nr:hypothetical protein [Brevibacillus borstelensis]WNF05518.1 hypothetical protein RFB14_24850 [Brevibacillus borstelensis]
MSFKGSEKEFILSLFLLQNPEVLENALDGIKLGKMEAEVPAGRKKIDLLSVETNRRLPVYIETQIKQSDTIHLNTILGLFESVREGIVVWIARSFQRQHLERIVAYLKKNKQKYISFHAIEIHPNAVAEVEKLNQLYKLDIWYQLKRIAEHGHPPLKQFYSYSQIPPTHSGRAIETTNYNLTRVEDVKQYLLDCLRNKVPHYLNVWKAKKHNRYSNQLSIGAGKAGVDLKLSACNQQGLSSIYLHFDGNQRKLYDSLRKDIRWFQEKIHPDLTAHNRKVGVIFKPDADLDVTISKLAEILERMLTYFGPNLYEGYVPKKIYNSAIELRSNDINKMRCWVKEGVPGIQPKIASIVLEEPDNEQAYKLQLEQLSECFTTR